MADATISATLKLVDGFSAPMRDIESSMSRASKAGQEASRQLGRLGDSTAGIERAQKASSGLMGSLKQMTSFAGGQLLAGQMQTLAPAIMGDMEAGQKLIGTMTALGYSTKDVKGLKEGIEQLSVDTGYSAGSLDELAEKVAATGASAQDVQSLTSAMADLNAAAGGSESGFTRVSRQLLEVQNTGKLTAGEWSTMERLFPAGAQQMQKAMEGAGGSAASFQDALQKGTITSAQFNQALEKVGNSKAIKNLATTTAPLNQQLDRLKETVVGVGANFLESFQGMGKGQGIIDTVITAVKALGKALDGVARAISPVAAGLVQGFSTAATMFSKLVAALQDVGAFTTLEKTAQDLWAAVADVMSGFAQLFAVVTGGQASIQGLAGAVEDALQFIDGLVQAVDSCSPLIVSLASGVLVAQAAFKAMSVVESVVTWLRTAWAAMQAFQDANGISNSIRAFSAQMMTVQAAGEAAQGGEAAAAEGAGLLDAAMDANPIGLVALALGAVAAAAVGVIKLGNVFYNMSGAAAVAKHQQALADAFRQEEKTASQAWVSLQNVKDAEDQLSGADTSVQSAQLNYSTALQQQADALKQYHAGSQEYIQATQQVAQAQQGLTQAEEQLSSSQKALQKDQAKDVSKADAMYGATKKIQKEYDGLAKASGVSASAHKAMDSAMKAATGSATLLGKAQFQLEQDQAAVSDSQDKLNSLQKAGVTSGDAYQQALDSLHGAQGKVTADQTNLSALTDQSSESMRKMGLAMLAVAGQSGAVQKAYDGDKTSIDDVNSVLKQNGWGSWSDKTGQATLTAQGKLAAYTQYVQAAIGDKIPAASRLSQDAFDKLTGSQELLATTSSGALEAATKHWQGIGSTAGSQLDQIETAIKGVNETPLGKKILDIGLKDKGTAAVKALDSLGIKGKTAQLVAKDLATRDVKALDKLKISPKTAKLLAQDLGSGKVDDFTRHLAGLKDKTARVYADTTPGEKIVAAFEKKEVPPKTAKLLADMSSGTTTVAQFEKIGLDKKTAQLLAEDKTGRAALAAFEKLGIPPKTAQLLAEDTDVKSKVKAVEDMRLGTKSVAITANDSGFWGTVSRDVSSAMASLGKVFSGHARGGYINGFATGGLARYDYGGSVLGAGTGTSDSIPAMLSNGEYVMPANTVSRLGVGFFDSLREGVPPSSPAPARAPLLPAAQPAPASHRTVVVRFGPGSIQVTAPNGQLDIPDTVSKIEKYLQQVDNKNLSIA